MAARLEHANLCVHDIDSVVQFLQTAFPEFDVRHDATGADGVRWVHVGTDDTYVALTQAKPDAEKRGMPYRGRPGLNHLAYEVDDVDALSKRLSDAGYQNSTVPNSHPYRKRVYFYDPEGNDWEFIEYLSEECSERHDYELPEC
ncbi:VOC family protein [Bythopirellula polymerisocia]|uniref:Glyoxalase/Bleomycin resistance protein/Dioxygenase superfamily protein n=1 Tax=Bythopirellula polymerisocia TaxID=2528003 RepID=A0A5C6CVQ5_9BACT|nr:VOC family protein [Bythopirellula polymerisocia]TWU28528.1 Glyoxalase/Bleomycin resistance protein/Dioxygenase superfamily protein [Bythopirellula polymerisocia]